MKYDDFIIQISTGAEGMPLLQVTESPVGESVEVVCGESSELRRLLGESRGDTDASPEWQQPETLGQRLFDALFVGAIHQRFLEALGHLGANAERGLRLQIRAGVESPMAAEAHALPWEYLYRADTGSFLALDRRFALVRNLRLGLPHRPGPTSEKLRLLIAIASPSGLEPLESEEECRAIAKLWGESGRLEVDMLAHATLERLREKLLAHRYHGLHLIGHGCFDELTGDGELLLEDSHGEEAPCSGRDLAIQLTDRTSLRWVFLNACSTGCSSALRPFGGLATALLRTGVAAVIAMQRPVSDRAAIVFSTWFYRRLAAGDPVDTACTEGRLAIHRDGLRDSEWGIPLLFLRARDGHILGHPSAREEPATARQVVDDPPLPELPALPERKGYRSKAPFFLAVLAIIAGVFAVSMFSRTDQASDRLAREPSGIAAPPVQKTEAVQVRHAETLELSSLGARLTAEFNEDFGAPFVRVTLAIDGEPNQVSKTLMGPHTFDLGSRGLLRVQGIDWQRRLVTVVAEPR